MLQIHNNLSNQLEPFTPIDPQRVRIYVCGMTVYDYCHIGHARVLVVFDVVYRYLCKIYGEQQVTYVRNVTDIDDKIIQRANENGEDFSNLTSRFVEAMHEDADALGVLRPNEEPHATTHMDQIVEMIAKLVEKGYAYPAANGDVYYDVSKFEGYGKLSGKNPEDLRAGERVAVDTAKDDPLDFVLWKAAKPGEPSWESPWGNGRPGWHIECSAMSTHCLGNHFDIHGGGLDLQFPHHENEIAQSEAATGCQFVNVWMHNGFVRVDDEKMSKSLGNFFTIREVMKQYDPEVIRYFILTSHYRSPLNYSDKHLDNAKAALSTLYTALKGVALEGVEAAAGEGYTERFYAALDDDFATSEALAVLFEMAKEVNRLRDSDGVQAVEIAAQLKQLAQLLGILQRDPVAYLQGGVGSEEGLSNEQIETLIEARLTARSNKEWAESDRIRDELQAAGIVLEDGAGGTTWRRG
ncbi:cysteine--tRNA ligase [Solemya pervernicosa gill symbiont]|uniref:Cysteine--tRNA ligase n=2 Tax=Gammaproteobacteria incertae sedis TaxID=118884 RepID=A0A1T2L6V4_9GAMM|nr:cysteine--tRNA ligase [Candidatus Reidiella endopervernicosa]OOZ40837.1 cysteine--tRNA ligase [Solemya pervernicosa gill symbiont]QKQ28216.1 cysteine--tRNA ligase [Candidatus Reidiella endopervernicosa]